MAGIRETHLLQTRIDETFARLKGTGSRPALVTFVTAGDPDYQTSLALLRALPASGADVIELGMPFSDPMADGPAIQASSHRALKHGQTLRKTLAMVRAFRETDQTTPIVLMGYYNPIYIYGSQAFVRDAKAAGVDGLIVVDRAARGGQRALPAVLGRRAQFHPPGDADDQRQASPGRARQYQRIRLLCFDCGHNRYARARHCVGGE